MSGRRYPEVVVQQKVGPEMDVGCVIDFATSMLLRSDDSWRRMTSRQRLASQKAIFPTGVRVGRGEFGNYRNLFGILHLGGDQGRNIKSGVPKGIGTGSRS